MKLGESKETHCINKDASMFKLKTVAKFSPFSLHEYICLEKNCADQSLTEAAEKAETEGDM